MNKLKIHILRKLYDHTYVGRRHCAIRDMRQGLPSHERDMKNILKTVKDLINGGYLIPHKTDRISLNPRMLKKIKETI